MSLLAFVPFMLHAQSVEQWIAWGDAAMARGEHYGASRFYAGAMEQDPGRMALQWKQAEACRLSNQYDKAAELYDRVFRKDQGRTYPKTLRWLGEMQLCNEQYTDAERTWRRVQQRSKDATLKERAKNALAGIELAKATPSDTTVLEHLPSPVNTFDSEFGARIGPDSVLYFTSLRGELNDDEEVVDTTSYHVAVYSSRIGTKGWSLPMQEQAQPDAMGDVQANLMWSSDNSRMYFTMIGADGTKHIATRTATSPAQLLTGLDAYPNATQPWVAFLDGSAMLLFVSEGGEGGTDIWIGDLDGASVSNIRNAGRSINTPGNESTPSFDATTGTLWFSSDFHPGLGGYDIFHARYHGNDFGTPVNARAPINSPANDLYPALYPERGEGWITSNRRGSFAAKGATCCNDLYRFTMRRVEPALPPITADTVKVEHLVALKSFQQRPPIMLYFHNDEPEPRTRLRITSKTYGATYAAYKKLQAEYERESGTPDAIRSFFTDHVDHGYNELAALADALHSALDAGEQITLEVRGHASPLAVNDYNQDLSQRRITSLRNHLRATDNGVLATYMDSTAANGGILRIRALPFGEDRSLQGVSDDLNDLRGSVYAVGAARERRIEIERIVVDEEPDTLVLHLSVGTVQQGVPATFQVPFRNTSGKALNIIGSVAECDCFGVRQLPAPLSAGDTGAITVQFTGRAPQGPVERHIMLDTDGRPSRIVLKVTGTVSE